MPNKKPNIKHKDDLSQMEQDRVSLWTRHGIEDVYFQRDASVNFWTILGGIAVAALLTQVNTIIAKIVQGQWYSIFYFLTSIALIINSWAQNTWGSIVLRIPVTMMHTFLMLMNLLFLSIACLQVTSPALFFLSVGIYILFGLFLNLYLMRSGAWVNLTRERFKSELITQSVYLGLMILCFLAVAHLYFYYSTIAEAGWGIFAIVASSGAMGLQHNVMKRERKEVGVP